MKRGNGFVRVLSRSRFWIQVLIGLGVYTLVNVFDLSIWWVILFGSAIGLIWGKVFCRWMCPIGVMMELFMKISPNDSFRNMYQYHKIGCPIAWVSGLLNKVSIYKIQLNKDTCKNCGLCDKACYMPALDQQRFSLFKKGKENPAENYSCSKCLSCVAECPNGSLSYKPTFPTFKLKK